MVIPEAALDLENRSIGDHGEPTLGATYAILRDSWRSGQRDRELALYLLFLCWYLDLEPAHITGFDATANPGERQAIFNDAHDFLLSNRVDTQDVEALYVVGVVASIAPWLLGDVDAWTSRSEQYRLQYRALSPAGIDPDVFWNRGAYGDYFEGQTRVKGGF